KTTPSPKPGPAGNACAANRPSTACFSLTCRLPVVFGVSCAAPAATRRRPGWIRNGALTSEKSNGMVLPSLRQGKAARCRLAPAAEAPASDPLLVLVRAGVDLDLVAGLDEERHRDLEAGRE